MKILISAINRVLDGICWVLDWGFTVEFWRHNNRYSWLMCSRCHR